MSAVVSLSQQSARLQVATALRTVEMSAAAWERQGLAIGQDGCLVSVAAALTRPSLSLDKVRRTCP